MRQLKHTHLASYAEHQLVIAASVLVSQHALFVCHGRHVIIPAGGATVTLSYHKDAMQLLQKRYQQLDTAYQSLLIALKRAVMTGQHSSIADSLNRAKQLQQFKAGVIFIQKQYMLMRSNSDDRLILPQDAYEQCMTSAKGIAKRFVHGFLGETTLQQQLFEAAVEGDADRVLILLAQPAVDVNQVDLTTVQSALYLAVQAGQFEVVKMLTDLGASEAIETDAEHSALTLAMLRKDTATVDYLKANLSITHTIKSKPLHQGPSEKNVALKTVEYIFHCMIGIEYISHSLYEAELYAVKYNEAGNPLPFTLEKNDKDHWIAHCPNGRRYHLSLALKHANFDYWMLNESSKSLEIIKRCERELSRSVVDGEAKPADKMTTDIGNSEDIMPLYAAEQAAIEKYTGVEYKKINSLLRAMPFRYTQAILEETFICAMLMISGINKHRSASDYEQRKVLTRHERNDLPKDMFERMKTKNQITLRAAPISFSEEKDCEVFNDRKNTLQITNAQQRQASVKGFSFHPKEKEVIFPPTNLKFTSYKEQPDSKRCTFSAVIVHGVEVEYHQQYLLELAQHEAYDILVIPYKESRNPRFGIARHNHALAHHMRVSMLVVPVIEYFRQHAAADGFKSFCDHLTPQEVVIMQVMMMFSRVGRESEAGPSQLETFLRYNRLSAEVMARFLQEHMDIDESTVEFYMDVLINAGNPRYAAIVTGATEEERQRKLYFSYIAALAHKLDLPRVFGQAHYEKEMSPYNGSDELVTGGYLIYASERQRQAFNKLESIAMKMLKITGDNLCFTKHGIDLGYYNQSEFKRCNTDITYCRQQCEIAHMRVLQENQIEYKRVVELKNAVDRCQPKNIIHLVMRFTIDEFEAFKTVHGIDVVVALLQSSHDYSELIEACISFLVYDSSAALKMFYYMVSVDDFTYAGFIINKLDNCGLIISARSLHRLQTQEDTGLIASEQVAHSLKVREDIIYKLLLAIEGDKDGKEFLSEMLSTTIRSRYSITFISKLAMLVDVKAKHVSFAARGPAPDYSHVLTHFLLYLVASFEGASTFDVVKIIEYARRESQQIPTLHYLIEKGYDPFDSTTFRNLIYRLARSSRISINVMRELINTNPTLDAVSVIKMLHKEPIRNRPELEGILLSSLKFESLSVNEVVGLLLVVSDTVNIRQLLDVHVQEHGDIMRTLIQATSTYEKADQNAAAAIKYIIEYRGEDYVDHCLDVYGRTELMLAIKLAKLPVVEVLLDAGANLEATDIMGSTPAIYALAGENYSIRSLVLFRSGSPPFFKTNKYGISPLRLAMLRGMTEECVQFMVVHGDISQMSILDYSRLTQIEGFISEINELGLRLVNHLYATVKDNAMLLESLESMKKHMPGFCISEPADYLPLLRAISDESCFALANFLVAYCKLDSFTIEAYELIASNSKHPAVLHMLTKNYLAELSCMPSEDKLTKLSEVASVISNVCTREEQLHLIELLVRFADDGEKNEAERESLRLSHNLVFMMVRMGQVVRINNVGELWNVLMNKECLLALSALATAASAQPAIMRNQHAEDFFKILHSNHCGLVFQTAGEDEDAEERKLDEPSSLSQCVII
ncbi:MAG: SidE phosphodiesterase domain-containing protein [Coxiellaceae bacterium]|nr:SidE phosphodiesterase domain-containing protein [Coxiellaceae bacterium]